MQYIQLYESIINKKVVYTYIGAEMGGIVWSELFPTKLTLGIFIGYIALFISQGIQIFDYKMQNR